MKHVSLTPFGCRPVESGLLAARQIAREAAAAPPAMDKWALFADIRTARARLALSDRDLAVLHALLTFLPGKELRRGENLIVFPSNRSLSERSHGMAESTLRRHLAALVGAGLIWRQDSPNGKRFARRDHGGGLTAAYGFDLSPLLLRAGEIAILARATEEEEAQLSAARTRLVLLLRDCGKLIAYGRTERPGETWATLEATLAALRPALRRKMRLDAIEPILAEAETLFGKVTEALALRLETEETNGSAAHSDCHHTDSNQDISESEEGCEALAERSDSAPAVPLQLVVKACPDLQDYSPGGLRSWRDLMATAEKLHPMMGISASTWAEAQRIMGPQNAGMTLAAMLQRISRISNPGGYLRSLSSRAAQARFTPVPMIMALLSADGGPGTNRAARVS